MRGRTRRIFVSVLFESLISDEGIVCVGMR